MNTTDEQDTGDNFADPNTYDPDSGDYNTPEGWVPAPEPDYSGMGFYSRPGWAM